MDDVKTGKAGRVLWAVTGLLLLLLWVASMSLDDDRLCNAVPLCFGFAAVLVLAVIGMLAGARPARPTLTFLCGLGAGLYFFIRCVSGDMLSEMARELPLILAAFVFYGAGFFMAQRRGGAALSVALVVGVVVNIVYFFLFREGIIPIEAMGRPSMSLSGASSPGCTLFTYRNFSAIFMVVAGGVLICRPFWSGWGGWAEVLGALVGMVGVVCACLSTSRAVLPLLLLLLVAAWVLWVIIRLYSEKRIGWGVGLVGVVLLVGMGVFLGEIFIGNSVLAQIVSVDTHGRIGLWNYIYNLLPDVPWYGHGAGATQWQLVPFFDEGLESPNYAHNEYLQAWVDYGVAGMVLMLAVFLSHLTAGFWSLASEDITRERRLWIASSMLLLISLAAGAVFDFVWHNIALAGLTAFACGMLASPVPSRRESLFRRRRWAAGYRPSVRPVRLMDRSGMALACMGCVSLAAGGACLGWRLLPAWQAQWAYNALWHAGASEGERVEFLERVMLYYPDPELLAHYVTLTPPARRPDNLARKEQMARLALQSNPHQLFTLVILTNTLGRMGKCEEAEMLLREHYVPGGMPGTNLANWPAYYGLNLLMWGKQRMDSGDHAAALSMMEYALNLWGYADDFVCLPGRSGKGRDLRNKATRAYISARRVDVDLLRAIGVQKDDSWKAPMRPGGSPALYERWGNEAHSVRYRDPYAWSSPLKI